MNHLTGLDRSPTLLYPEPLEDYVGPENPVRFSHTCRQVLELEHWLRRRVRLCS